MSDRAVDRNARRPLRPGDRAALDRRDEVHRLRGRGHQAAGGEQPADGLGLPCHECAAFSSLLGVVEIAIGVLIAFRPVWPMGSAVGSGLAAGMFLTTLSFLVTTPGWEPSLGGFPALSAMPGQFLLKDVVLLGAALWSAGEAWAARPVRTGA